MKRTQIKTRLKSGTIFPYQVAIEDENARDEKAGILNKIKDLTDIGLATNKLFMELKDSVKKLKVESNKTCKQIANLEKINETQIDRLIESISNKRSEFVAIKGIRKSVAKNNIVSGNV